MKKVISIVTTSVILCSTLPVINVSARNFDTREVEVSQKNLNKNDLSYGIVNSEYEKLFDDVVHYVRENQYTRTSQKEFNQKIEEMLSQKPNMMTRSYYSDLKSYINSKLNYQEQQLFNQNRWKGILCMANGKLALNYAEELYSAWLHNWNGDAFRHIIWNYGMAQDVGHDFAKKWADAHEYGSSGPWLERAMDLHNNELGRTLHKENGFTLWHSSFKSISRQAVRDGRGYIISGNQLIPSGYSGEK